AQAAAHADKLTAKRCVLLTGPAAKRWAAMVLDADGLNALAAGTPEADMLPPETVLTPHPGEMARLLGTTVIRVQADRPAAARACAEKYRCVAVLKGSGTLVATPDGTLRCNPTGNPGLARGGSGDVLAGMIAALLAQGLCAADAACCGVFLHGAAADACAKRRGMQCMLPHDILDDLGGIFARREQE
ncbi:MAG: NAD(P)H-hydrate dehydratase, partial [Gemmiger sp.]